MTAVRTRCYNCATNFIEEQHGLFTLRIGTKEDI